MLKRLEEKQPTRFGSSCNIHVSDQRTQPLEVQVGTRGKRLEKHVINSTEVDWGLESLG